MNRHLLLMHGPVHVHNRVVLSRDDCDRLPDGVWLTDWVRGYPITVVRQRTEDMVPVPFNADDWASFDALLNGGAR